MLPPATIEVSGMNCKTGATAEPAALELMETDVKARDAAAVPTAGVLT